MRVVPIEMNDPFVSHGAGRVGVLCTCLLAGTALACHRTPLSLVGEVLPLRDRGYVLVDSTVGALGNDVETYREVALDSGGTYVLLAECDCQGMSVGVAPSSFWRKIAPYHLIPDFLDEAYSQTPHLRFVVSETRRHLIRIRMSDCAHVQFRDGEWTSESAVCTYGLYLLKEPAGTAKTPGISQGHQSHSRWWSRRLVNAQEALCHRDPSLPH